MNYNYYYSQIERINEATEKSAEKQLSLFQHILLVSSSTFGIVISLHTNSSPFLCIHLVFALSVVLLSLGILSVAIVVFDHSFLVERTRQAFRLEVERAMKMDEEVQPVFVSKKRRTLFCEKIVYIVLPTSALTLCVYALLSVFMN